MKKTLVLFILFAGLLLSLQVNAQFFYGVKAGYTGYKLMGKDVYGGMNYVYGPSGGFIFGVKFKTDFNLQSEILYTTKGVHQLFTHKQIIHSFENDTTPVDITDYKKYDNVLKTQYVEIPILIKKSISFRGGIAPYDRKIGKLDFDMFLGPYFGYRFGSSVNMSTRWIQDKTIYGEVTPGTETVFDTNSFYMGRNVTVLSADTTTYPTAMFLPFSPGAEKFSSAGLNAIDLGLIAGIGFSYEVSQTSKLTFDARYSIGMLSIDKTYFNNVTHTFVADNSGTLEIASQFFSITTARTKVDVKNSGFGLYLGFIHYF